MTRIWFVLTGAVVLAGLLGPPCCVCLAQENSEAAEKIEEKTAEVTEPPSAEQLRLKAEALLGQFAQYANRFLGDLCANPMLGWLGAAVTLALGMVLLMFGWTLLRAVFVPFCAVVGFATGASAAAAIVLSAMPDASPGAKRLLLSAAAVGGTVVYGATALKARPIACMLVVAAPFLAVAALLLPLGGIGVVLGMGAVVLALAFGFGSVLTLRPLAIVSTAALGAVCLAACWGLLGHLLGEGLVRKSADWSISHPLALVVLVLCLAIVGASFQFNVGPREGEPPAPRKRPHRSP